MSKFRSFYCRCDRSFSNNTNFCGWVLGFPRLVPEEFILFKPAKEKVIVYFAIYPLYHNEMMFKLQNGYAALEELLLFLNP
ncbi:MAG: suppressor of fused domain protein [Candidatus Rickettsia vulgarisii]